MKSNSFPEELTPSGSKDFKFLTPEYAGDTRVLRPETRVKRVATHPWFIVIWEPLTSKVPNPGTIQPYCCYARTVIFYIKPYVVREFIKIYKSLGRYGHTAPGHVYEQVAELEHTLSFDDLIEFEGEGFRCGGGSVVYHAGWYYMRYRARRLQKDEAIWSVSNPYEVMRNTWRMLPEPKQV